MTSIKQYKLNYINKWLYFKNNYKISRNAIFRININNNNYYIVRYIPPFVSNIPNSLLLNTKQYKLFLFYLLNIENVKILNQISVDIATEYQ